MRLHSERRSNSELFWTALFVLALITLGIINIVYLAGAMVFLSAVAGFTLLIHDGRYPLWIYFIPISWLLFTLNKLYNIIWDGVVNFNDWLNNR